MPRRADKARSAFASVRGATCAARPAVTPAKRAAASYPRRSARFTLKSAFSWRYTSATGGVLRQLCLDHLPEIGIGVDTRELLIANEEGRSRLHTGRLAP